MPFAQDRKDRMWNAQNLNNLYARFDNKCARALDGKTPFVVGMQDDVVAIATRVIPLGVQYDYCKAREQALRR